MKLSDNHPFFLIENDIKSIVGPFLHPHDITFFDYGRYYGDKAYFLSTNNDVLKRYLFNKELPPAPSPKHLRERNKFCYMIRSEDTYSNVIHDLIANFNIANCINFVERHEHYCEYFCFGSNENNHEVMNLYLNDSDMIQNFILNFKEKSKNLLHALEKNKIDLLPKMLPDIQCLPKNSITKKLTPREKEILHLYVRGKSARIIAILHERSQRTIESQLDNIKRKIGAFSKSDLIDKTIDYFK